MIIFTDGSTLGNGKKDAVGGIGVYIPGQGSGRRSSTEHTGSQSPIQENAFTYALISTNNIKVTNQVCELIAVILGIEKILSLRDSDTNDTIYVYTDSKYVIDCATTWCKNWISNGWKNSKNKIIDNIWLIYRLVQLTKKHPIIYKHIKAHSKEPAQGTEEYILWKGNDFVDKLAQESSRNANSGAKILNWKSLASLLIDGIQKDMNINIPYCDVINECFEKLLDDPIEYEKQKKII